MRLNEFDNKKLAKYKTAAAADAKKADAEGDFARGNKRFKGINTATKKQFANDAKKSQLKEFAPSDDGGDGFSEEILKRLAAQWWNNDEDPRVEQTLMSAGWEIGQDDGYDNGGVFVVQAGDDQGDSYISWPAEDLQMNEGIAEATYSKREKAQVMIYKYFGQIYDYGDDDGLNYLDEQGELWNQLMDKYDGEIEDIVAREPTEVLMQAAQELKVIADEMEFDLDEAGVTEAAQGHTIEAHGVRGMDRRTWHKTFRNTDQMIAWAEKHDAEIIGTRDLEQARHGNLSPAKAKGVAEGSLNELSKDTLKSYAKKAVPDMQASQNKSKAEYSKATSAKDDETANKHYDAAKQAKDRTEKRMAGVAGAIKRFNKEGVAEGSEQKPAITYKDYTLQYDYQTEDDDPEGYSTATTYYFDVLKDGDRVGEAEYFDYFGNLTIRINGKTKEFGFRHPLASQISQLVSSLPDKQKKDLSDPRFESQDLTEVFADQGSGSTDRDNADYMKRRNAAKKKGYTGRETKAGTWRVFKDGNAVAAAGPFKSADEAAAWIKKHKQGVTEMDKSEPSAGRDTGPRPGPDREAKPITAKKATKDAADMLTRAVKDSRKKKDVAEDSLAAMRRLAGIVPQVPLIMSNGQRQYRHMPTAVQPR